MAVFGITAKLFVPRALGPAVVENAPPEHDEDMEGLAPT